MKININNKNNFNIVKIISLSLIASSLLATTITPITNWNYYPLNKESTAQTRGGDTQDKIAIQDGVGVILIHGVVSNKSTMDNTTYNQLLYKHKDSLSSTTLKALIENNTITLSNDEIADINVKNEFVNPNARGFIPDNTPCDDNEIQTIGDKYINGVCVGNNVQGQSCNDTNPQTINDIYTNGVCLGTSVPNGLVCNDNNIQTINDRWNNGVCLGDNVENQSCNDNEVKTINDKYHNGICAGTNVEGQSCNDTNPQTINDIYTNGVCSGTNVEGQSCNDNNLQTIDDKYVNGICLGTSVPNGSTCNDNNVQTITDTWLNGICAGVDVEGQPCEDANVQTINDVYHNGICQGTNVEGQVCEDGNVQTINDIYHNGVCAGINVQGQSCDDINEHTYDDKYDNGICIGITYIPISLASSGFDFVGVKESYIKYGFTNIKISTSRGWRVTIFDKNWNFLESKNFDTYLSLSNATLMNDYINTIADGYGVVLSTWDEPATNVTTNISLITSLKKLGATSSIIENLEYRSAYGLIGIKGTTIGTKIQEKYEPRYGNTIYLNYQK